jgi:hypothetical protein
VPRSNPPGWASSNLLTARRTGGHSEIDTFSKRTSRARLLASWSRTSWVARAGGSRMASAAQARSTSTSGVATSHTQSGGLRVEGIGALPGPWKLPFGSIMP